MSMRVREQGLSHAAIAAIYSKNAREKENQCRRYIVVGTSWCRVRTVGVQGRGAAPGKQPGETSAEITGVGNCRADD